MLTSHVDAPVFEKPRLFSHWKPSLAQVTSDLPAHNPATLQVCVVYVTLEHSDTTVLGSTPGGSECKYSRRSEASGIAIYVFISCFIT
jgi:hypothetical protein